MRIRKGDTVVVISGSYKGVKGAVLKSFPEEQRVIVEKVNFIKRHVRPNPNNQQGGIVEKEAPIHVSNVRLFNSRTNEVTRPVWRKKGDKRVRLCRKTGDEM
ncbi:MAG: 50S ribosomal protein L24 [Candidatus Cloacimonetes bacterium]|nr:50S ribosomal protein L24 [Candidatus Cloacimonadota bacterium]